MAPVKSAILIDYNQFNYLIIRYLFADAEFREYLDENIVVGDFACDGAQVVDDLADVFA